MAAYGAAVGIAIALAVVTFALRGKGTPRRYKRVINDIVLI